MYIGCWGWWVLWRSCKLWDGFVLFRFFFKNVWGNPRANCYHWVVKEESAAFKSWSFENVSTWGACVQWFL